MGKSWGDSPRGKSDSDFPRPTSLFKLVAFDTLPACLALRKPSWAAGTRTVHAGLEKSFLAAPFRVGILLERGSSGPSSHAPRHPDVCQVPVGTSCRRPIPHLYPPPRASVPPGEAGRSPDDFPSHKKFLTIGGAMANKGPGFFTAPGPGIHICKTLGPFHGRPWPRCLAPQGAVEESPQPSHCSPIPGPHGYGRRLPPLTPCWGWRKGLGLGRLGFRP